MVHKLIIFTFTLLIFCLYSNVNCFFCDKIASLSNPSILTDILPEIFKINAVQFYLYTNEYEKPQKMRYFFSDMKNLKFDPSRKTVIVVHGFIGSYSIQWVQEIIAKLRSTEDINAIAVDWSQVFARTVFNYRKAAVATKFVAERIYKLLLKLSDSFKTDLKDWHYLHLIGHSLGAHVVGQTAELLKKNLVVHRITAFDAANPYFDKDGVHQRLNRSHAQFVDAIHTNANPNEDTFGFYEPIGHIDFYPNGGDYQPGCNTFSRTFHEDEISKCFSYIFFGVDATGLYANFKRRKDKGHNMLCDHAVGQQYFLQTIDGESKFLAHKVDFPVHDKDLKCSFRNCSEQTCVEMGINAVKYNDPKYYGTYYIDIPNCTGE